MPARDPRVALRRRIAPLHGGFVEVVWPGQRIASHGVGPRRKSDHTAHIGVHGVHGNLGFCHGACLADPDGLLEGSGKRLRHVKAADVAGARGAAVSALLRRAITDRMQSARRGLGFRPVRGPVPLRLEHSKGGARLGVPRQGAPG
jgi:hypothetical protein